MNSKSSYALLKACVQVAYMLMVNTRSENVNNKYWRGLRHEVQRLGMFTSSAEGTPCGLQQLTVFLCFLLVGNIM
jgi:hypothetical protein